MSDQITSILKKRIKSYKTNVDTSEQGEVITVADGIATVAGLLEAQSGELLEFDDGVLGIALNLEEDIIGVIILGSYSHINEGSSVKRTGKIIDVGVGDDLLGRVVNPLGQPLDGKGKITFQQYRPIEKVAPGIMTRESVSQPLKTGIIAIDSIIPIGKGQRELIIGDRKTGKTSIAIDTIINQKGKDVKVVYVSIGQKNSTLATTMQTLIDTGAMDYTTIVAANASDSDALQYISPFAGMAMAEEWMSKGEDVLIVFDDLTKHAVAYRTVSLLLRRPPGREAYPGDVFYLHSRLLERAGKMNQEYGGGSITALPIIETQAGDISAYIPTNVISITDGQIFLMADAFNSGQRPAVDAGLSVSRVGSSAQTSIMKKVSGSLKLILANYEEIKAFAEFSSDSDQATKDILNNGSKVLELIKQPVNSPIQQSRQEIILFGIQNKMFQDVSMDQLIKIKKEILTSETLNNLEEKLRNSAELTDELSNEIKIELENLIK